MTASTFDLRDLLAVHHSLAAEPDAGQLVLSRGWDERTSVGHVEPLHNTVTAEWQEPGVGDDSKMPPAETASFTGVTYCICICNLKTADLHKDR